MNPYIENIEEITLLNTDYRRVLFTTNNIQLVVMSLKPGVEIGMEKHELAQFIRIESGDGEAILNGKKFKFSEGFAIIIPEDTLHNIINNGDIDLKLYSIYAPPEHKHATIHREKENEREEHFDGETS